MNNSLIKWLHIIYDTTENKLYKCKSHILLTWNGSQLVSLFLIFEDLKTSSIDFRLFKARYNIEIL